MLKLAEIKPHREDKRPVQYFFFFQKVSRITPLVRLSSVKASAHPLSFAKFMNSVESENMKSLYTLLSSPRVQNFCFNHMTLI